ncbi:hypothetical protein [Alishewanella phage vB_AspM_Slickus01]|nr:hypothetical protein [Alishewanella phage vB_AspM_Slickus01]
MKKRLTIENMYEIIRLREVEKYSYRQIEEEIGVPTSTAIDFYNKITHKNFWENFNKSNKSVVANGHTKPNAPSGRLLGKNKTFVVTSAQNNTFIHKAFFDSLLQLCKHRGAELLISTFVYNKSGFQNGKSEDTWYDPKIIPFIMRESVFLAKDLVFCGELNILPTAVNPMSGFESYCGENSAIIPHAKQQMQSLPAPIEDGARFIYTTGCVTRLNYIQQKAGQKAAWNHIIGALIVEVDEFGDFFVRQINASADNGEFYDLDYHYSPSEYTQDNTSVLGINWGDLHIEKIDPLVAEYAFGLEYDYQNKTISQLSSENILDALRPRYQFAHDTADFSIRNHHNIADPHFRFKQFVKNDDCVESSFAFISKFLSSMARDFSTLVVVESNHDMALMRWIKSADYKQDPANAVFFLNCQLATYNAILQNDRDFHLFKHVLTNLCSDIKNQDIVFLNEGDSFKIHNIECGYHGHKGANGTKGSARNFLSVGRRVNLNHSHSACIINGVFQAGTCSSLRMGYNEGSPSSWSHTHIVTYCNGKRTNLTMKNGKWRRKYD